MSNRMLVKEFKAGELKRPDVAGQDLEEEMPPVVEDELVGQEGIGDVGSESADGVPAVLQEEVCVDRVQCGPGVQEDVELQEGQRPAAFEEKGEAVLPAIGGRKTELQQLGILGRDVSENVVEGSRVRKAPDRLGFGCGGNAGGSGSVSMPGTKVRMGKVEVCLASAGGSGEGVFRVTGRGSKEVAIRRFERRLRKAANPLMQKVKSAGGLTVEDEELFARQVRAAKEERRSWEDAGAFDVVQRSGVARERRNVLKGRWVLTWREAGMKKGGTVTQDGLRRVKARYVVKGFMEESVPGTDTQTASKDAMMLGVVMAAVQGHEIELGDVSTAFLRGAPL